MSTVEGEIFEPNRSRRNSNADEDDFLVATPRQRTASASAEERGSFGRLVGLLAPSETLTNTQPQISHSRKGSISNMNPNILQQALLVRNRRTPGQTPNRSPAQLRTPTTRGESPDRGSNSPLVVNVECPSD